MRNKYDYFMQLAIVASQQSKCLKRHIGAVIVDDLFHVKAIGYNGTPRGFAHCTTCKRDVSDAIKLAQADKDFKLPECPSIHAEANAILQCDDKRHAIAMFTTTYPCINCAKLICNTNIKNIVYLNEYDTDPQNKSIIQEMFNTAGVVVTKFGL